MVSSKKISIKYILPWLIVKITRFPRQKINVEWSKNSWVHNFFRAYELIFWRRFGIRAEASTYQIQDRKGKNLKTIHVFFTWEALLAHIEGVIRGSIPVIIPERVWIPSLITPTGFPLRIPNFVFSIATDATCMSTGGSATSRTVSHTCSGSNRILIINTWIVGIDATITGTYNSVTTTELAETGASESGKNYCHYLVAPDTGAHDIVMSRNNSGYIAVCAASYTGVKQTSPLSGTHSQASTTTQSESNTVNITDANSWVVGCVSENQHGTNQTAGAGTTQRVYDGGILDGGIYDSGGATSAATYTLNFTNSNSAPYSWVDICFAMAPISTDLIIDVNDAVTVAENIAIEIDLNPNVNDAVSVAEDIATGGVDLGDISVFDAVSVTESVVVDAPIEINVSDSVVVSESLTATNTDLGEINVNEAITVSENITATVSATRRGLVVMRSTEQSLPIPMTGTQQGRPITLRGTQQDRPRILDDGSVL